MKLRSTKHIASFLTTILAALGVRPSFSIITTTTTIITSTPAPRAKARFPESLALWARLSKSPRKRVRGFAGITLFVCGLLLAAIIFPAPAFAACFKPAGNAGDIIYNPGYSAMQYCNGGAWVKMGGPVGDTATGLVGYWKFDDGSGTSAIDSSGNGNTGTLQNTPTWTTSGMNGGALTFNGTNQFVTAPDVAPLQLSGSWTVSSWVNFSALPASGRASVLVQKIGAAINYELLVDNGDSCGAGLGWTAYFSVPVVGGICAKYLSSISTGTWYHVVGVWDSSSGNQYVYLNGQLVMTHNTGGVVPPSGSGMSLAIGAGVYGNYLTTGTIDDVRVYNRALSAKDIMTLYTSTGGTSGDIQSNLVGYWKFDEGSGTAAADSSGNGNTGTLNGNMVWTTGKINGALQTSRISTNNNVSIPSFASNGSQMTYAYWAYFGSSQDADTTVFNTGPFSQTDGTLHQLYDTWLGNSVSQLEFFHYSGGSYSILGNITVNLNAWNHIVEVVNGDASTFYLNGVQVLSASGARGISSQPVTIGGDQFTTFNGKIDDFRIYNRALSASDVLTLYNATATACASPVGYAGNEMYNKDYHVMQFCNGAAWIPMGKVPGTGGSGCSSPAGNEGDKIYTTFRVVEYCDGTTWRAAGNVIPISGLVGWWNFDEGSGTTAADSSGNGNTGTLYNTPTWTTSGMNGGGLNFAAASSQYVNLGTNSSLAGGSPSAITVSAWVKPTGSGYEEIAARRDGSSLSWMLWIDYTSDGRARFGTEVTSGPNPDYTVVSPYITPGVWTHIVGVYSISDGVLRIYVNGVAAGTTAGGGTINSSSQRTFIGADAWSGNYFNGTIDDVRIYNRALSASEVGRLYNGAP